jgi:ATP-dependent Lon protease
MDTPPDPFLTLLSLQAATVPSDAEGVATGGGQVAEPLAIPDVLPILPSEGVVLFPHVVMPVAIRSEASSKLLEETLPHSKLVGVLAQHSPGKESPGPEDLYGMGAVGQVLKWVRQSETHSILFVEGLERFSARKYVSTSPFLRAEIQVLQSKPLAPEDKEAEAAVRNLRESALDLATYLPDFPEQTRALLQGMADGGRLADFLGAHLEAETYVRQAVLEELDVRKRVQLVQGHLSSRIEIARIQQRLNEDVKAQFTDAQRRAYLREQIRAIQRELGEDEGGGTDEQIAELRERLKKAAPPEEVLTHAERELKRLEFIPAASPEYSVIVSYVETLAELPWSKLSEDQLDLKRAQEILDRDHFDLEKVKRRLIEFLAVRKLNPAGHGPILCFLGPPGVGKTSLGQSIADALGRKFARISLGGMRDEAEIRGHRRTYIGSMPGRIIQELRRVGTRNPVIMLDEIDKLGADFRGDPASALLEVLDPRQNHSFSDRYLDVPFDLSQVLFIATANYVEGIPGPLRDRMETIHLPGYTEAEKLGIARRYLVGRQLAENGLKPEQIDWEDAALERVIADYTRESGVRELERQIGAVCRSIAARVAAGEAGQTKVTPALVEEILGPQKYVRETHFKTGMPGVATGLAYTPVGGEVLYIEAVRFPGKGGVTLTGQIGAVMKESVQAAYSLVRARCAELGIDPEQFSSHDIHVHVPAGAVPKDGPSAGVAMFTAIASLFLGRKVRSDVAMTGEITLRGLVLPIGGLKEKSLAALRAGITTVVIPALNQKDLADIPAEAHERLKFVPVATVDEALAETLEPAG